MGAFTYAMPRCVWMPHWLRQRDAAFAGAAAAVLSRFLNMTGVSVELSVAVSNCLPHFCFSRSLSACEKCCQYLLLHRCICLSMYICDYVCVCVECMCVCVLQPLTFRLLNDSTISANEIFLQRI